MDNIINILKTHGLKATPQRVTILEAIEKRGHANIDEIYQDAKVKHSTMSLATVYKNVTSLLEKKLLKELAINNFKSKYEINKTPHSHLICKKCGSVEDIHCERDFGSVISKISKEKNFDAQEVELNIYGICKKCK